MTNVKRYKSPEQINNTRIVAEFGEGSYLIAEDGGFYKVLDRDNYEVLFVYQPTMNEVALEVVAERFFMHLARQRFELGEAHGRASIAREMRDALGINDLINAVNNVADALHQMRQG